MREETGQSGWSGSITFNNDVEEMNMIQASDLACTGKVCTFENNNSNPIIDAGDELVAVYYNVL